MLRSTLMRAGAVAAVGFGLNASLPLFAQSPTEILRERSATENIVFGRVVSVRENNLNIQLAEDRMKAFRMSPETQLRLEYNGEPIELKDLPPDVRIRMTLDDKNPEFVRSLRIAKEDEGILEPEPGETYIPTPVTETPAAERPVGGIPVRPANTEASPTLPAGGLTETPAADMPAGTRPAEPPLVTEQPVPPVPLGMALQSAPQGVMVVSVEEGSPAEKAGLKTGDYILRIGDTDVITSQAVNRAFHHHEAKSTVNVVVMRNDRKMTAKVSLPADFQPQLIGASNEDLTPDGQIDAARADMTGQMRSQQLGWVLVERDGTVQVTEVAPNSLAARSGLQAGDIIVAVSGEDVHSLDAAEQHLWEQASNGAAALEIRRMGERLSRGLMLPEAPLQRMSIVANKPNADGLTSSAAIPPEATPNAEDPPLMTDDPVLQQLILDSRNQKKMIVELLDEVRMLRQEMQALRGGTATDAPQPAAESTQPPAAQPKAGNGTGPAATDTLNPPAETGESATPPPPPAGADTTPAEPSDTNAGTSGQ